MTRLPILTFHALDTRADALAYPPEMFARVCAQLHDAGWRTLAPQEVACYVREHKAFPPKHFVLTFDDGYASVYHAALPLLEKYGWRAALFIAPGADAKVEDAETLPPVTPREMLCWREIRALHARGFTIGAHTLTHCDLTRVNASQAEHEIIESGKMIARALDAPCDLFAYPYGRFDAHARALVAAQYEAAFSTKLGLVNADSDVYALERVEMYYLRAAWTGNSLTKNWLRYYLALRNVLRRARENFLK